MRIKELNIGYVPYSTDLQHPDDRRRFPLFAKRQGIVFEVADFSRTYDLIILPAPANLSGWLKYKRKHPQTKFIFEMVDSLIYQSDVINALFKGTGRFLLGKESSPVFSHKSLLIEWLKIADIVLCSSPKLCEAVKKWNKNVLLSIDYLEHEYPFLKENYEISGKMKLLWEGQGVVLSHFLAYREVLNRISDFCELHICTSKSFPAIGPFFSKDVMSFLKKIPIVTRFHEWNLTRNQRLFTSMDCAIIPLNPNNSYGWHKPANKLLSFWFSGLPVLCSNTPAYSAIANQSGANMLCSTPQQWVVKMKSMAKMKADERREMAILNYEFVQKNYGAAKLDEVWFSAFHSLND